MKHVQFFWGVSGSGIVEIAGRPHALGRNRIAIYFTGMVHNWYTKQDDWDFLYMTLDGPFVESIVTGFGLESAACEAGPPPFTLFDRLSKYVPQPTRESELQAGIIAYTILARAAMSARRRYVDELVLAATELINTAWGESSLNVNCIAAKLSIQPTTLCRRFQKAMGISPATYLTRLRVQNALNFLQCTAHPIKEIAAKCGFSDPNYFSRVIHNVTGYSPKYVRDRAHAK